MKLLIIVMLGVLLSGCVDFIEDNDVIVEREIIVNEIEIIEEEDPLKFMYNFLENDNTNEHQYLPWYTCGHYARDLVRNATAQNITMGSVLLSNSPVMRGSLNHCINYFEFNNATYFIEPQSDEIISYDNLSEWGYRYGRYYANGDMIPTFWRGNKAHSFDLLE